MLSKSNVFGGTRPWRVSESSKARYAKFDIAEPIQYGKDNIIPGAKVFSIFAWVAMWARGIIEKTQMIGMRKNRDGDRLAALHLSLETARQRKWISRDLST